MVRSRTTVKPGLLLQPHVLAQLGGRLVEQVVEGSAVTPPEYAFTSWLNVVGRATPSDLARDLGLAPTTVSALVQRLVRKGQVRRARHPEDGRSYVLELTARGQATNARNAERLGKVITRLRRHLDADEEETLAALRTLEEALRRTLAEG